MLRRRRRRGGRCYLAANSSISPVSGRARRRRISWSFFATPP